MTSKLKCPFCGYELQENRTTNLCCPICGLVAPTKLWQALIQAKQDLEIARKALDVASEKLRHCVNITVEELDELKGNLLIAWNALLYFSKDPIANNALKKITAPKHKE